MACSRHKQKQLVVTYLGIFKQCTLPKAKGKTSLNACNVHSSAGGSRWEQRGEKVVLPPLPAILLFSSRLYIK